MKALKILGIVVLGLIALIIVLGLIAPKEYSVERTVVINSPKELVFKHVKFWRNWQAWSPWAEMDSTMQVTFDGKDGEEGSVYKWVGDPKITGKGEITNTGVVEFEKIDFHIHNIEPYESESDGYVKFAATEAGTQVAWGFYGETPFPWNIMNLFNSMDRMIGGDFERGLQLLKQVCEKEAAAVRSYTVSQITFRAQTYAAIQKEVAFNDMKTFFENSFAVIDQALRKKGTRMTGAPVGIYFSWDEEAMTTDMAAAVPIRGSINTDEVKTVKLPAAPAYSVDYFGPYSGVMNAYNALDLYLAQNGLTLKPPVIEEYISNPVAEPDSSKWLTKIYYFVE